MPRKRANLTGKKFGRLTALEFVTTDKKGVYWLCQCDCGTLATVKSTSLTTSNARSCGCLQRELSAERLRNSRPNLKHGMKGTPTYECWGGIIQRCNNPKRAYYHLYGGRGIKICDRWLDFENFFADMGEKPSNKHSIDRIDNDGDYEPSNCRWATVLEQANNRRDNKVLSYVGLELTVAEWARRISVSPFTLYARIRRGWTIERTLENYKGE